MTDFGLYVILTDPVAGYEACCEAAVRAGVRMLQLRMKDAPHDKIAAVGRALRKITAGTDTAFIVNDDPSIAAEVGADGVHVGQADMPVPEVRRRFPSLRIVGLSTHNPGQVAAALLLEPDYIGAGPVFATPTKKIPDPALAPATAGKMIAMAPFPAVAIGGINLETLPSVLAVGARNFAVVRPVCKSTDPYSAIVALQKAAKSTWGNACSFARP